MTRTSMQRILGVLLGLLLGSLVIPNVFLGFAVDATWIHAFLAAMGLALVLAPRSEEDERPSIGLLVLLFLTAGWNSFVNIRYDYGAFVHAHDAGHYYLGSRYFDELGYFGLYAGLLVVLEDSGRGAEIPEAVRDLRSNLLKPRGEVLASARATVVPRFGAERWERFELDAKMVLDRLDQRRLTFFLQDHGYNATPIWTWLAQLAAAAVPAGSSTGLLLLSLIDPFLLALAMAAMVSTWGRHAALLCGSYFFLIFGATSNWVGGGFGRFPWLVLLLGGICLWIKKRHLSAGCLLGLAATLRIFPILFVMPLAAKALYRSGRGRGVARRYRRLFAGVAVAVAAASAGATLAVGIDAWGAFGRKMIGYLSVEPSNAVGLRQVLEAAGRVLGISGALGAFLPKLILAASGLAAGLLLWLSARRREVPALVTGVVLCFLVFDLGGYYYSFLILPFLAAEGGWRGRAPYFAIETASHLAHATLGLPQSVLFIVRSLLVGWLFLDTWLDRLTRLLGGGIRE